MANKHEQTGGIDESLYSRQLYTYGVEAMQRMKNARILISGIDGLGLEIAKNVTLSGVASVTIHDPQPVHMADLSSLYYATEADIGSNRAEVCFRKLVELNPYVKMNVYNGELTEDSIKEFSVVVLANVPLDELIRINDVCRANDIKFISADTFGLSGKIFCDFGKEHTVSDVDGEEPQSGLIENVTNETNAKITCVKPHNLTNANTVKLMDVKGLPELNGREFNVKYVDRTIFSIEFDTTNLGKFGGSGEFVQTKHPQTFTYKSLRESMENPEFVITDFAHFERPSELHACYLALNELLMKNEEMTFDKFLPTTMKYNKDCKENTIKMFFHCYRGNLCPFNGVIGGVAAQEVMKASSYKYTPINQWLYFDRFTCLPKDYDKFDTRDLGCRYDGQIRIFGRELQAKMADQRFFIVGSGAVGSDGIKNFGMMGLATSEKGKMIITDMDTIERSNLNRQFLFRNTDIGKPKSHCAVNAVKQMNPQVNAVAHENRVGIENEKYYNRQFYAGLNFIVNALDNVNARLYMDSQCVLHGLPLLESGTLGTKGNVQIVVPGLTESYGSSQDPPEEGIPVCTLKNFPNDISHTIQYSRDQFEGLFDQAPKNALEYLQTPEKVKQMQPGDLITAAKNIEFVLNNVPKSFEDCVKFGFQCWHEQYRDQIQQLLHRFPPDSKTSTGDPFWTGSKKCPTPFEFDSENQNHLDFVFTFANLWANVFGLKHGGTISDTKRFVKSLAVPKLQLNENVKISLTEAEEKENQKKAVEAITPDDVYNNLPDRSKFNGVSITPLSFEKDDDTNFHIDFITSASNMRALNYGIKPADRLKTKGVAGRIIPAIAQTTAIVSGLASLELYKIIQGFNKLEDYQNGFINLATSFFGFSDPLKAPTTEFKGKKFSMWDHFEIRKDMTLREFLDYFKTEYDYDVEFVNYNEFMIFASYFGGDEIEKRSNMKIRDIIESNLNTKLENDMILLTIDVEVDDEDLKEDGSGPDLPQVKYYLS